MINAHDIYYCKNYYSSICFIFSSFDDLYYMDFGEYFTEVCS